MADPLPYIPPPGDVADRIIKGPPAPRVTEVLLAERTALLFGDGSLSIPPPGRSMEQIRAERADCDTNAPPEEWTKIVTVVVGVKAILEDPGADEITRRAEHADNIGAMTPDEMRRAISSHEARAARLRAALEGK